MSKGCRSKIYCNEKEPDSGLRYDMYLGLRMITYHTLLSSFSSVPLLDGNCPSGTKRHSIRECEAADCR